MKILLTTLLAAFAIAFVTGCKSTAEGFGKDMEKTGEKIQDKVD
jgi:predicted small secreted protein